MVGGCRVIQQLESSTDDEGTVAVELGTQGIQYVDD
jgi:hypothetical protein